MLIWEVSSKKVQRQAIVTNVKNIERNGNGEFLVNFAYSSPNPAWIRTRTEWTKTTCATVTQRGRMKQAIKIAGDVFLATGICKKEERIISSLLPVRMTSSLFCEPRCMWRSQEQDQ